MIQIVDSLNAERAELSFTGMFNLSLEDLIICISGKWPHFTIILQKHS